MKKSAMTSFVEGAKDNPKLKDKSLTPKAKLKKKKR